ncbi:prepilin-type N-terminal cleavage/methylation domain-containing protein [Candidatus Sumerlaeota bacterium]|nr:prepilin-type N-terminal cleavage/methylation domain-containing protein [Candidatus Sumerlaeales bacterium]NLD61221.1 prepilin-type N-terminal cleavage/methylation domain-containing protein [Candidatus Sumerlaeota bacterium]
MKKGFTLVEIMIVVAIIGIILSIAVPSFIRARETSRATACQANLKQYDAAKQQWALENKKNATETPVESDLIASTLYIKATPLCPNGGDYTIGDMNTDPACSIGTSLGASNTAWHHILTK